MEHKNFIKVRTGLYSKVAFEIFQSILRDEQSKKYEYLRQGGFFFNRWLYYFKSSDEVPEFRNNFVSIADDGEVYFIVTWMFNSVKSVSKIKLANAVKRFAERALLYYPRWQQIADFKDGAAIICKHLLGKCTRDDIKSELFDKYVGFPLDPFKAEAMKMKKAELEVMAKNLYGIYYTDVDVPAGFEPDAQGRKHLYVIKACSNLYNEYISYLN